MTSPQGRGPEDGVRPDSERPRDAQWTLDAGPAHGPDGRDQRPADAGGEPRPASGAAASRSTGAQPAAAHERPARLTYDPTPSATRLGTSPRHGGPARPPDPGRGAPLGDRPIGSGPAASPRTTPPDAAWATRPPRPDDGRGSRPSDGRPAAATDPTAIPGWATGPDERRPNDRPPFGPAAAAGAIGARAVTGSPSTRTGQVQGAPAQERRTPGPPAGRVSPPDRRPTPPSSPDGPLWDDASELSGPARPGGGPAPVSRAAEISSLRNPGAPAPRSRLPSLRGRPTFGFGRGYGARMAGTVSGVEAARRRNVKGGFSLLRLVGFVLILAAIVVLVFTFALKPIVRTIVVGIAGENPSMLQVEIRGRSGEGGPRRQADRAQRARTRRTSRSK